MKIFITGASGFVGGAAARKLSEQHEVLAMARSEKSAAKVKELGAIPVACDLKSISASHLQGCDVVIHCAAFVEPWGTRAEFWEGNVEGTRRTLEAAKAAGVKRFIHIGTEAAVFHGQDMVNIDETYPYAENSPYLYSQTKAAAEKLVLAASEPGKFESLCVRPRFVWGPDDLTILPNLVGMVKNGAFKWVNQGEYKSSTTYIDNLVHAIDLALTNGRGGEAYFVTDGEIWTMRKFLTAMLATQGVTPSNQSVPAWVVRFGAWSLEVIWKMFGIKKAPPIVRFSAGIMSTECTIRIDKARKELGYEPVVSIGDGLKAMQKPA
ncbi:MAG: NAD-dependent epimerase/dehydratase family protein [Bacteroidia bacterium]|nr:NAD-dependent epimerase/dehydratase family protein [Bacteroidia bacterium]